MTSDEADGAILAAIHARELDTLETAFAFSDGRDIAKAGLGHRRRTQFTLIDQQGRPHRLFLKRYQAEPLSWRIARLLRHGPAKSAARVEHENIVKAREIGVATMHAVHSGQEAGWLFPRRSYIIVTAVPGEALSQCMGSFLSTHGSDASAAQLLAKLAAMVARLHKAGFVHRDLYTTHVFLDEASGGIELYLIDLARMFQPRWRVFRWRVKDLAQLKFSLPPAWVAANWERLLQLYFADVGVAAGRQGAYCRAIDRKAGWMRRRALRAATRCPS